MGFIPPYGYQGPNQTRMVSPPVQALPPVTTTTTTSGNPTQTGGGQSHPSNPLTGIIDTVLGPIGGLLGGLGL